MSLKFRHDEFGFEASAGFSADDGGRLRKIYKQLGSFSANNPAEAPSPAFRVWTRGFSPMSLKFRECSSGLEASAGFSTAKRGRLREIRMQLRSFSADQPAEASSPGESTCFSLEL
jgi:hypothetical protein